MKRKTLQDLTLKDNYEDEVSKELMDFLNYVESGQKTDDVYVRNLDNSVKRIKADRQMGEKYMLLEEMMKDEFKAGKAEGLAEGKAAGLAEGKVAGLAEGKAEGLSEGQSLMVINLLSTLGEVPESLKTAILAVKDPDEQTRLCKCAAKATSIQEFMDTCGILEI